MLLDGEEMEIAHGFFTVRIDQNQWARGQSSRAIISEIGIHFSELMKGFFLGFDACLRSGRRRSLSLSSGSASGINSPNASAKPNTPSARATWRNSSIPSPCSSSGRWTRILPRPRPHTPATNSASTATPSVESRISPRPWHLLK